MIHISIPAKHMLSDHWFEIKPFVERAVAESNGELTMDSILKGIEENRIVMATVFNDEQLIAVCSFEQTEFESGKRVIHIHTAGGESSELWIDQITDIANALAKQCNCSEIYVVGRKGWERKLKHLGYSHAHTILSREVI